MELESRRPDEQPTGRIDRGEFDWLEPDLESAPVRPDRVVRIEHQGVRWNQRTVAGMLLVLCVAALTSAILWSFIRPSGRMADRSRSHVMTRPSRPRVRDPACCVTHPPPRRHRHRQGTSRRHPAPHLARPRARLRRLAQSPVRVARGGSGEQSVSGDLRARREFGLEK